MSYSYYPCNDTMVADKLVQQTCPTVYRSLADMLAEHGNTMKDLAKRERAKDGSVLHYPEDADGFDKYIARLDELLDKLTKKFFRKTGIRIFLTAQGETQGEYDDAYDFYWRVDRSTILKPTPAFKKHKEYIYEIAWVEGG